MTTPKATYVAPASSTATPENTSQNDKSARRLASNRSPRWAFMERFEVPNLDNPTETYLSRLRIIQTPWFALYLHRMDGPDSRPTLHDHPWSFVSLVLRGGYVERRLDTHNMQVNEAHRVRWVNRMRTHDAHAITRLLRVPTWTFLFVGPRRRTWGYVEPAATSRDGVTYGPWTWTEFDKHRHTREFDRAMAVRRASHSHSSDAEAE